MDDIFDYDDEPDEPDDPMDDPWTDGHRPHTCGAYVEEHALVEGRWVCPR